MELKEVIINSECMRDFCGTFNGSTDRSRALIEVIPEATRRVFFEEKEYFDIQSDEEALDVYKKELTIGFKALLEDERTSSIIRDWINGTKNTFTDEDVKNIYDVFYVDCMSFIVEEYAIEILNERGIFM